MTGPSQPQHRNMHRLWRIAEVPDRVDRLALTGAIVGRQLASSKELTAPEALNVIDYLSRLAEAGQLAERARGFLAEHRPTEPEPAPEPEPVEVGGDLALFAVDEPPTVVTEVEQLSAGRRRTIRQTEVIGRRVHPLSLALGWTLKLHDDAQVDRDAGGPRCGSCAFRVLAEYHNRTYPKCTADARPVTRRKVDGTEYQATEYPRVSNGAGTDVRGWWPACPDHEPAQQETQQGEAAR